MLSCAQHPAGKPQAANCRLQFCSPSRGCPARSQMAICLRHLALGSNRAVKELLSSFRWVANRLILWSVFTEANAGTRFGTDDDRIELTAPSCVTVRTCGSQFSNGLPARHHHHHHDALVRGLDCRRIYDFFRPPRKQLSPGFATLAHQEIESSIRSLPFGLPNLRADSKLTAHGRLVENSSIACCPIAPAPRICGSRPGSLPGIGEGCWWV